MKRILALITALLLLLTLTACFSGFKRVVKNGNKPTENSTPEIQIESESPEKEPPQTEAPVQPEETPADPDTPVSSPAVSTVGKYKSQPEGEFYHHAIIEFFSDGTHQMNLNMYEGFNDISGTYTVENKIYRCKIDDDAPLGGYIGQNATGFDLEPQDAHSYVITIFGDDGLGILRDGHAFYQY